MLSFFLTDNQKLMRLREKHIKHGHNFDNSVLIEKLTSEKHPHTDKEFVFTISIRKCNECGLIFYDKGLEYRIKPWDKRK